MTDWTSLTNLGLFPKSSKIKTAHYKELGKKVREGFSPDITLIVFVIYCLAYSTTLNIDTCSLSVGLYLFSALSYSSKPFSVRIARHSLSLTYVRKQPYIILVLVALSSVADFRICAKKSLFCFFVSVA
jgi:hypothetical protein